MFDMTKVAELIFAIISLLVTTYLIPYFKSKTSKEQQAQINILVITAVSAAEQIYVGSGRGKEKKEYVINWLAGHKIKYDAEKIDAMIEAAVYDLKMNGVFIASEIDTTIN